jgi:hypothetical protein
MVFSGILDLEKGGLFHNQSIETSHQFKFTLYFCLPLNPTRESNSFSYLKIDRYILILYNINNIYRNVLKR